MEQNLSELGFRTSHSRLDKEKLLRDEMGKNPTRLGVTFLDKAFYGLTRHDLVLIGAKTGVGKTELITSIALSNARNGKKVFLFALEAEEAEIERRFKFKYLSERYQDEYPGKYVTYRDFLWGNTSEEFKRIESEGVHEEYLKNLFTYYRSKDFGIKDFQRIFAAIESQADLIIVDHIHFFDMETENENKELGEITKKIRDLVLISGVPVILVGHLRKPSEFSKKALPDIYDFHGSSNLPKQITKGVIIDSGGTTSDGKYVTYMRIVKDRSFGASTRYIGKVLFDPQTNSYESGYKLAMLTNKDADLKELDEADYPKWLR
jgi:replicative DNA helicase